MSTFEHIIVEQKGAVGIVRLNRPKMLNALSFGVFREIAVAIDDLEAEIDRVFRRDDGHFIVRRVPGSFHEFITRKPMEDGALDLAFDASNAQGIFKMTAGAGAGTAEEQS